MSNLRVGQASFLFNTLGAIVGLFSGSASEQYLATYGQDSKGNLTGVLGPNGLLPMGVPVATWANRPAATQQNSSFFASDVGGGNFFYSTGVRFKPVNGSVLLDAIDTANVGPATTAETQVNPTHNIIPAGVIAGFDRLRLKIAASKSGVSDTCTIGVRLGNLGTVADPLLATITLLQASQSMGYELEFKRLSATTVQKQGCGDANVNYAGQSATAYPAAVTVLNMDSVNMFLTLSTQMTAGGSDVPTLQNYTLELFSTDS